MTVKIILIIIAALMVLFIVIPFYVSFLSSIQMRAWIEAYTRYIRKRSLKQQKNGEKT